MTFLKTTLPGLITLLAMITTSILLYPELPPEIPSHFNFQGEVGGSHPRELAVSLLPLINLLLLIVVNVALRISPVKFSMPNSKRAVATIIFAVGIMFGFIHYGLLTSVGEFDYFVRQLSFGTAGLLIVTGNVFGKTERNFFIGLRIPWTIASVSNWKGTTVSQAG